MISLPDFNGFAPFSAIRMDEGIYLRGLRFNLRPQPISPRKSAPMPTKASLKP
jgi:hypothetical protein